MSTIDWKGRSGRTYRYWFIQDVTANGIQAVGGNYAFVKRLANGNFVSLYFGQADNMRTRIPGHDRWEDARRAGVTHVMGHTTPGGEQATSRQDAGAEAEAEVRRILGV